MDYSLELERTRINRIISKYACNYTSPVSLAKQSLNKLTRHRKLYSYEFDSIKDQDSNMHSVNTLLDQPYNCLSHDRNNSFLNKEHTHHSSQHIFTFQTIREAMVANPDLAHVKYLDSSLDKNIKTIKVRTKNKINSDPEKVLNHLPSLKKIKSPNKRPEIFSISSHRAMAQPYRSPEDRSKFSKLSEIDIKDLSIHGDTEYLKDIRTLDRKIKGFIPGIIKRTYKKNDNFAEGVYKHSRVLHVVLPKYNKNNYFNDTKVNRNFSDEETSIKGWDKSTPLGMNDSYAPNYK